jgi:hypothetical protein
MNYMEQVGSGSIRVLYYSYILSLIETLIFCIIDNDKTRTVNSIGKQISKPIASRTGT